MQGCFCGVFCCCCYHYESLVCFLTSDEYNFRAYPIKDYPCKTKSAAAIMLMIMNNLDPSVAQVSYSDNKGSWIHRTETNLYVPSC